MWFPRPETQGSSGSGTWDTVGTGQAHASHTGLSGCVGRTLGSLRKSSLHDSYISKDPLFCFQKGRYVIYSLRLEVVLGNINEEPSCWCSCQPLSKSSGLRQWPWPLGDFVLGVCGTLQRTNRDSMTIETGRGIAAAGHTDPMCAPLLSEKAGGSGLATGFWKVLFCPWGA